MLCKNTKDSSIFSVNNFKNKHTKILEMTMQIIVASLTSSHDVFQLQRTRREKKKHKNYCLTCVIIVYQDRFMTKIGISKWLINMLYYKQN